MFGKHLFSLTVCLGVGMLSGCSGKKDKDRDQPGKDSKDKGDRPNPILSGKPDFTLTSQEWAMEWQAPNTQPLSKKYDGKFVELTGPVKYVGFFSGHAMVPEPVPTLTLEGVASSGVRVRCLTASKEPWKKALPGQTVTLRGKGRWGLFPALVECEVVEVKGDPPPTVTAEELAEAYAKNRNEVREKYYEKFLLIEGEITGIEWNPTGQSFITLKTKNEKLPVSLGSAGFSEAGHQVKDLKVAQKVKALAIFHGESGDRKLFLNNTLILESAP